MYYPFHLIELYLWPIFININLLFILIRITTIAIINIFRLFIIYLMEPVRTDCINNNPYSFSLFRRYSRGLGGSDDDSFFKRFIKGIKNLFSCK